MLKSIVSYKERGAEGNNKYRGNCSGEIIKDLHSFFKFDQISDYARGSNTTGEVAQNLGIVAHTYDLSMGFDLLNCDIQERNDFIFYHPAYWDIIPYSGSMWGDKPHPSDLSRISNYNTFIKMLDYTIAKQYASLNRAGRMAILVGDIKKRGKLYSMVLDMLKPGTLENIIIKTQHNCFSDNIDYKGKFIPIVHEYLVIIRKDDSYIIDMKRNVDTKIDIRDTLKTPWKDIVASVLEKLGKKATLDQIYREIEGHKRAQANQYWKEKVRQTLTTYKNIFYPQQRGLWALV